MKIEQHYCLNLKRRPERLYAWLGCQWRARFDFSKLTIFDAFDAQPFEHIGAMLLDVKDIFMQNGLDYRKAFMNRNGSFDSKGLIGNMISKLLMLIEIEKHPSDDYFMLWEDDIVLNRERNYQELISTELPSDATLIAFHSREKDKGKLHGLPKHPTLPFRKGTHGIKANQALMLTKQGAKTILDIYRQDTPLLELEFFIDRYRDLPGLWTSEINFADIVYIEGVESDIHQGHERNEHVNDMFIYFKEQSIKDIYG